MTALINNVRTVGTDEWYTSEKDVEILLPYIKKYKTIWCPFDLEKSNFVKVLKENGLEILNSHIATGKDFFQYEPSNYDAIISNPPFSLMNKIIERVYELNKPFALVSNIGSVFDSVFRFSLFRQYNDIQLLIPAKRMKFFNDDKEIIKSSPAHKSVYICRNLLPKQICFEGIIFKDCAEDNCYEDNR